VSAGSTARAGNSATATHPVQSAECVDLLCGAGSLPAQWSAIAAGAAGDSAAADAGLIPIGIHASAKAAINFQTAAVMAAL
jgi:hypothetical protein